MRPPNRQRGDCLQLHAAVWAGGTAPGARQRQGVGLAQANLTGRMATPALPWALCLQKQGHPD